jgi:hypothetical protein
MNNTTDQDGRKTWLVVLEAAAMCVIGGKQTGCAVILINQGGIQNRVVPKEIKNQFKSILRQYWPGLHTTTLICNIAEGKLRSFNQK